MDEPTWEAVKRWLTLVEEDFGAAKTMLRRKGYTRIVCFHAQQCAEKVLKAFLAAEGIQPERTHDLVKLVDLCSTRDERFWKFRAIADRLSMYAVAPRYPDDWREIPLDEARQAVKMAEEVMRFVKGKLGE